jgi:hypothetical protein
VELSYYSFVQEDIKQMLQLQAENVVNGMPKNNPPEGFSWHPLAKVIFEPGGKISWINEWVAKPNGK